MAVVAGELPLPDWFYHTVSRPLLFRMPAAAARDVTLGFMGKLARVPGGPALIDFLGHMRPDRRLETCFLGVRFPTAVGLGPGVDGRAVSLPALARFGFGFLEVGPIRPRAVVGAVKRQVTQEAIWFSDPRPGVGLETGAARLTEASRLGIPLIARLEPTARASPDQAAAEVQSLAGALAPRAALLSLSVVHLAVAARWTQEQWQNLLHLALEAVGKVDPPRPLLLCVPADLDIDKNDRLLAPAREANLAGWLVDGCLKAESGWMLGLPSQAPALKQVQCLRQRWGDDMLLIASGGMHEPEDALRFEAAGANLVQVDTGLIYSGPGLPKRVNDALLYRRLRSGSAVPGVEPPTRPAELTWCWTALLGAGMLIGGLLALAIAATRVVLPYDEHFVGMSRELLERVNPRLLAFMAHDRISLAGTMLAIGVMYLGLSLYGVRRGLHWARQAIFWSAFTGFISFFLFLGFGYLDPFHAFVTTVLLQLLLLGVHCRLAEWSLTPYNASVAHQAFQRY